MQLLAEGVESLKLACSLVLLIPAVGVALLGRRRGPTLVAVWIAVVAIVAWLRFAQWWDLDASGALHVIAGVALAAAVVVAWKLDRLPSDAVAVGGAALLAAWTWVPCVGRELGGILNDAPDQPWAELVPTGIYFLGLFVPLIAFAAAQVAVPRFGEVIDTTAVRTIGLGIVFAVGALVAVTLFDNLAGELARRSSF